LAHTDPPHAGPHAPTDQALVEAMNSGDEAAFARLYSRHRDWVVRLAYRFTRDEQDALDVLQEVFAYFLRKFPGFQLTANLTTFFYPVVKNLSLALLRKKRRAQGGEALIDQLPLPAAPETASRAELATVMAALPAIQREVVLMRFVDAMTLEEIAQALEIPLGTV